MWKPISTAPITGGSFLVRGGEYESEVNAPSPLLGVAHVRRNSQTGDFRVCNTCFYSAWINNPTEWHEIP